MAATISTPEPIHWRDVLNCSTQALQELTYIYFQDEQSLQMIVAELEHRGIDPYA